MDDEIIRLDALVAPYQHPYRQWMPLALSRLKTIRTIVIGAVGAMVAVLAQTISDQSEWFVVATTILLGASAYALWGVALAALHIREVTQGWDQAGTLRSVRERRPHAIDADPNFAHDEFAATVEDRSELWIWRYRALRVGDSPRTHEVLVPGRPQWAAVLVESVAYDAVDSVEAAERLAATQQRAADLEADARAKTHALVGALDHASQRRIETGSTAAALRHVIGQPDP